MAPETLNAIKRPPLATLNQSITNELQSVKQCSSHDNSNDYQLLNQTSSSSSSLQTIINKSVNRSKVFRCRFFVNGDKHFAGLCYVINIDRLRTFDALCAELSRLLIDVVCFTQFFNSVLNNLEA